MFARQFRAGAIVALLVATVTMPPVLRAATVDGEVTMQQADATSTPPMAYHWQQGQWFAYPLPYRATDPTPEWAAVLTDRDKRAKALADRVAHTGYVDGAYDPDAVTAEDEDRGGFSFRYPSGAPWDGDPFSEWDVTGTPGDPTDEDVIVMTLLWAGGSAPSDAPTRPRQFEGYAEERGAPPSLGAGHLTFLPRAGSFGPGAYDPLASDHRDVDYSLYETAGGMTAILRCNVMWGDEPGPQPLCDGDVRDGATGAIVYLRFPEHLIRVDGGWAAPGGMAFEHINRWRENGVP